ncbi:hypothetical protein P8C59_004130 [Phyllachora maydis]|uniref:Small ribosomal subunit protein bS18m n=1 Tax=Phyllachora maydis TaxID=1825666 RepID=A0AAD9I1Z2_9PEZI|nr:hypothetical protein P8C59_004130 [Phyllachora maydis]
MSIRPSLSVAFRCSRQLSAQQQHAGISTTCPRGLLKDIASNRAVSARQTSRNRLPRGSTDRLQELYRETFQGTSQKQAVKKETLDDLTASATSQAYMRQMWRRFLPGEVYAPRDLSAWELDRYRLKRPAQQDVLDMLGLNPVDNYRNFSMISEFMSPHGRILHSTETGLRPVNQRKMAKAIRRAIGLGIHPSVHRHPELIKQAGRPPT